MHVGAWATAGQEALPTGPGGLWGWARLGQLYLVISFAQDAQHFHVSPWFSARSPFSQKSFDNGMSSERFYFSFPLVFAEMVCIEF